MASSASASSETPSASGDARYSQDHVDYFSEKLASNPNNPRGNRYILDVRYLRHLCRSTGLVPSSCKTTRDVVLVSDRPISQSAFSDVYQGHLDGQEVAVKVLRIHIDHREKVKKAFLNEMVVSKYLCHPNIVPFLGTCQLFEISLVTKWMEGGTITSFLESHPEYDRGALVLDVIDGLTFMHSLDVVHGDLKTANVLVDSNSRARLTDFGLAIILDATRTAASPTGTYRYMAPELIKPEQFYKKGEQGHEASTKDSDVYALGIVIWEIYSGHRPFAGTLSEYRVCEQVLAGIRPTRLQEMTARGLNDGLWTQVQKYWEQDPRERPVLCTCDKSLFRRRHVSHTVKTPSCTRHQRYRPRGRRPRGVWTVGARLAPGSKAALFFFTGPRISEIRVFHSDDAVKRRPDA